MANESFPLTPFALTPARQGNAKRAGDQMNRIAQKADSVSKLSKVKAPTIAVSRDAITTTCLLSAFQRVDKGWENIPAHYQLGAKTNENSNPHATKDNACLILTHQCPT
jgi:hypothetical protein